MSTDEMSVQEYLKIIDDIELETSPCRNCKTILYWGFKFCHDCGVENEDFDPLYQTDQGSCDEKFHKEFAEGDEDEEETYCSLCGVKLL